MSSRKKSLYQSVFSFLKKKLNINPDKLMCDYEVALRTAAKAVWKKTSIRGCWFHHVQALKRRAKSMRRFSMAMEQSHAMSKIFAMFTKLPLLPIQNIETGHTAILAHQRHLDVVKDFDAFNTYYRRTWLKKFTFSSFCVGNEDHRTNNYTESFNAKMKTKIKRNPSMYSFLGNFNF
jgi:hypothetical protein